MRTYPCRAHWHRGVRGRGRGTAVGPHTRVAVARHTSPAGGSARAALRLVARAGDRRVLGRDLGRSPRGRRSGHGRRRHRTGHARQRRGPPGNGRAERGRTPGFLCAAGTAYGRGGRRARASVHGDGPGAGPSSHSGGDRRDRHGRHRPGGNPAPRPDGAHVGTLACPRPGPVAVEAGGPRRRSGRRRRPAFAPRHTRRRSRPARPRTGGADHAGRTSAVGAGGDLSRRPPPVQPARRRRAGDRHRLEPGSGGRSRLRPRLHRPHDVHGANRHPPSRAPARARRRPSGRAPVPAPLSTTLARRRDEPDGRHAPVVLGRACEPSSSWPGGSQPGPRTTGPVTRGW